MYVILVLLQVKRGVYIKAKVFWFLPAELQRKLKPAWWWYKKWPIADKRICRQLTPCWLRPLLRGGNWRQQTQPCSLRQSTNDKNTRTVPATPASVRTYRTEYRFCRKKKELNFDEDMWGAINEFLTFV